MKKSNVYLLMVTCCDTTNYYIFSSLNKLLKFKNERIPSELEATWVRLEVL